MVVVVILIVVVVVVVIVVVVVVIVSKLPGPCSFQAVRPKGDNTPPPLDYVMLLLLL
jgi:flagellar basal body-associated protein FliL